MDRNQSQMLLMTSERFGILLAESLEVGPSPYILPSVNIGIYLIALKLSKLCFSIVFSAKLLNGTTAMNATFNATQFNVSNSVFIPASFIQQRSNTTGVILMQITCS